MRLPTRLRRRSRWPILALYGIPDPDGRPPGDLHDHCIALFGGGRIVQSLELERLTRSKHANDLPQHLEELLLGGGFDLPDRFELVLVDSFAGRRLRSRTGLVEIAAGPPRELADRPLAARGKLAGRRPRAWVLPHELAHLGSLLPFTQGYEEGSLLVHVDGGASQSCASAWLYREGRLRLLHQTWDLQRQTRNFNVNPLSAALLGLPAGANLGVAGRLMGYAAYGRADPELTAWLDRHDWFQHDDPAASGFAAAAACDLGWRGGALEPRDPLLMDVAACMQEELRRAVFDLILRFQAETGARHLYYAGGVALNVQINGELERSGVFASVHVPPCCNDAGLAVGAAALFAFLRGEEIAPHGPFLTSFALRPYRYAPRFDVRALAARIARGEVVAVATGAAECGPRALGHRSLLASPVGTAVRDRVSRTMKRREWYRPVAPVCLRRQAARLFDMPAASPLARYMLGSYPVRPEVRSEIPGVVHADGSARVQVVDRDDGELALLAEVLAALDQEHGIPCAINTSFNRQGEPIVHTAAEATAAAWELGAEVLVLDNDLLLHPSPAASRLADAHA